MADVTQLTALEIARSASLLPITDVAASMGIGEDLLDPYGRYVAKISLDAIEALGDRPRHPVQGQVANDLTLIGAGHADLA